MIKLSFFAALLSSAGQSLHLRQEEENYLAQVSMTDTRECYKAITRIISPTYWFKSVNRLGRVFEDFYFGHNRSTLFWCEQGEGDTELAKLISENEIEVEWRRASEVRPKATLWGTKGIGSHDILEGKAMTDNWLLAALSALAEKPGRVEKLFVN